MALTTTVDQLLLTSTPSVPWPPRHTSRTMQAVVLRQDYAYVDSTSNIPAAIRGKVSPSLLVHGRLPLFKDEPGFLFSRDPRGNQAMVLIIKGTKHVIGKFRFVLILASSTNLIPLVVLPINILQEGRTFRTLAKQTEDLLGANITPSVSLQMQLSGSVFDNFNYFGGPRLRDNVNSILSAVTPEVQEVLNDGQFSLQNLLDLPQVHPHMTLPGPCAYLRIYTHLKGQPTESHDDATETGINHGVAFYTGKAKDIWRRARQHETNAGNLIVSGLYYSTTRRSPPQHRHMIPLIIFEQATVPEAVMNMAEKTMVVVFRSYQGWPFRPVQSDNVVPTYAIQQHRAQFMRSISKPVRSDVGWLALTPLGCNTSSPLFEFRRRAQVQCIPMAPGDRVYTRTFTTYRLRRTIFWQPLRNGGVMPLLPLQLVVPDTSQFDGVAFTFGKDFAAQGPKPTDARRGYLVFEIMDDKKPHPRAWIGVPSVGPFKNFDQASSLSARFEWYDEGRTTWYTVPLQRVSLLRKPMVKYVREGAIDKIISGWRLAMTLIQALEGIVYQEPLNGFAEVVIGQVDILQTDHLNQRYRW
ncbi:hypothetical protein CEP51_003384 [Fusarium floridanum]|uniref:Uncharacterized protein n=1 Tax=Fusarium floridanum TaxID=1325733 RepID=A0A428S647_9HYPO|nr:hypothetical protein CEP51_003384 [Fusarium floridanum]